MNDLSDLILHIPFTEDFTAEICHTNSLISIWQMFYQAHFQTRKVSTVICIHESPSRIYSWGTFMRRKVSEVKKYVPPLSRMFEQHKSWLIFLTCEKWTRMGGGRRMTEMINMDRDLILLSSALSEGSEVDGVEFGGAEGVCHEIAGCSGGHRSGQEAQSGPGHPLFGPRYE